MESSSFKFYLIITVCLMLNGCGTFISANISTSIDPSFAPNTDDYTVISSKDFRSTYYLPVLKEALENRGFNNVFISKSGEVSSVDSISVVLDVGRQVFETTKTVEDYGVVGQDVEWGDTKCKTTNNGLTGERRRCKTGKTTVKNIYGSTGTREETTTNLARSISLSFSQLPNNQTVISAVGTSSEDDYKCSDAGIYKFLIIHTVKYLQFGTPISTDYSVEIPEGYSCDTIVEYERSLSPQTMQIQRPSVSGAADGYRVTSRGLQYKVIQNGAGGKPARSNKVKINYVMTLDNGTILEASNERGGPQIRAVTDNIVGITEGLMLMRRGASWAFRIPPRLAYGVEGKGPVPPNSVINITIELLDENVLKQ